jgi:hypothetical protein
MTTHQPATTGTATTAGTTTGSVARAAGLRGVWVAGLLVAAGAGTATAHGLYQVAAAARVPGPIAWLYPLITDGLALVGYAATSRLIPGGGRRYAAGIVILAAGLSGLAQAVYLAGGISNPTSTTAAPVGLRFGVGAWPAIAAALTAHLLHLIGTRSPRDNPATSTPTRQSESPAVASPPAAVQPYNPAPAPAFNPVAVKPPRTTSEPDPSVVQPAPPVQPERPTGPVQPPPVEADRRASGPSGGGAGARDRARQAARAHYARHGTLPTVSELMGAAEVARGTAGTVLKALRDERPALHLVHAETGQGPDE